MTIKKTYGSFIKRLPVNQKKKNWLIRNWIGVFIGSLIGLVAHLIRYEIAPGKWGLIEKILIIPSELMRKILHIIFPCPSVSMPVYWGSDLQSYQYVLILITTIIIMVLIGASLNNLIHRLVNKK